MWTCLAQAVWASTDADGTTGSLEGEALSAAADTMRVAVWNVELTRDGPGLLLRDIRNALTNRDLRETLKK